MKVGDRIRVHPASDWYMRGITHAVITRVEENRVRAKATGIVATGKTFWLAKRNVMDMNGNSMESE